MAAANDMKMAEATYAGFLKLLKFGSIATVLVTAFVIFMIV